jgi:tRNA(Ile)-lysidine synthase TilS/MesJ
MALAYLLHEVRNNNTAPGLEIKAFVVDHAHRVDSTREAETVEAWLQQLGPVGLEKALPCTP